MPAPEPYVADPTEPRPPPRQARLRPLVTTLIALLVAGAVAYVVSDGQARQDPSLDVPEQQAP